MALPLNKEVAPAKVNFENVEEVMKTSDYQKLRNAISDLCFPVFSSKRNQKCISAGSKTFGTKAAKKISQSPGKAEPPGRRFEKKPS